MEPRFETIAEKNFAGNRLTMSFAEIRTRELWQSFMPRRREIANAIGTDLYSIEVYPPNFFKAFDPEAQFEKWAAVEVSSFDDLPEGLFVELTLTIDGASEPIKMLVPVEPQDGPYAEIEVTEAPDGDVSP